jgi:hypothetical protein
VGKGSAQQGGVVKVVFDLFLQLGQALFPLGIVLGYLFAVEVFNYPVYDLFQSCLCSSGQQIPPQRPSGGAGIRCIF